MTAPAKRSARVLMPAWNGHRITSSDRRRARIRALCALSAILTHHNEESIGEPSYRSSTDAHGSWMTVTADVRRHTWRTYRERELQPCIHCGRRNYHVLLTAAGTWECDDTAACAIRAARARKCQECGAIGTAWTIQRTEAGDTCKDPSACSLGAMT